jgi:hypothetical protein
LLQAQAEQPDIEKTLVVGVHGPGEVYVFPGRRIALKTIHPLNYYNLPSVSK